MLSEQSNLVRSPKSRWTFFHFRLIMLLNGISRPALWICTHSKRKICFLFEFTCIICEEILLILFIPHLVPFLVIVNIVSPFTKLKVEQRSWSSSVKSLLVNWLLKKLGAYLVTIANSGGFIQAPINKTIFSCLVFLRVAISCLKAKSWASKSIAGLIGIFLIATGPCHLPLKVVKEYP